MPVSLGSIARPLPVTSCGLKLQNQPMRLSAQRQAKPRQNQSMRPSARKEIKCAIFRSSYQAAVIVSPGGNGFRRGVGWTLQKSSLRSGKVATNRAERDLQEPSNSLVPIRGQTFRECVPRYRS